VEFAAAVNELVQNEPLALRMGTAARARYERLFSGPALGNAYRELYEEILSR
jgi:glycosyltransferase involved in cell wall biosynthesis